MNFLHRPNKQTRTMLRIISCFLLVMMSCNAAQDSVRPRLMNDNAELQQAIANAKPGDVITIANGTWKDLRLQLSMDGTADKPIVLRAQTPGKVFIEGQSDIQLSGDYWIVDGLYFRNGFTPSDAVITFRTSDKNVANHCRVTNCVIKDYNQLQRDRSDHWIEFWGRSNRFDHCYISGKSNGGPTIRVYVAGNESINNYHKIEYNHFGPRPRKGGPRAETIQLGDSHTSMSPSYTLVRDNFFERCNGEVEVISSKTNFNEFRNNVFFKCEGSLVTRHGNYCVIDGNIFIGDERSTNIGGIRLINTGHWVTNNYFYNLKGDNFRAPLAIMNGIPKSPLNRYNQVTDVVVAYNTWVNCEAPWHIGVGANIDQKNVLPPTEIRSARPERTIIANNLIYHKEGKGTILKVHDKPDGILFKNNYTNIQGDFPVNGIEKQELIVERKAEYLYVVKALSQDLPLYNGFEFEKIDRDVFGNSRLSQNRPGAWSASSSIEPPVLDRTTYGPDWFVAEKVAGEPHKLNASARPGDLEAKIAEAEEGDIIVLADDEYRITRSLRINRRLILTSGDSTRKVKILYEGPKGTPLFQLEPKADLRLERVILKGNRTQYACAPLQQGMHSLYNLEVHKSEINNFEYVLKAYKETFADHITFLETILADCKNGIVLAGETDDEGNYNVEELTIDKCVFKDIPQNVIDFYRGGYDESTIGGILSVTNSQFLNCGGNSENGILIGTYGIVNVNISDNTFKDNRVEAVAVLWGAKNNKHSGNKLINSGNIRVEENLKLKLVY